MMQKLGWYHYVREQYKDIPSNSFSDLITIGMKDEELFISRVNCKYKNSFITCWLSYTFYTR